MHQQRTPLPVSQPDADAWFEDTAAQMAVDFAYRDGSESGCYQLLESVGGGVLVTDYDGDGWQDLFLPGGGSLQRTDQSIQVAGHSSGLFRNGQTIFTNITVSAGCDADNLYTHGGTVTDIDADGFEDLVVCGFGGIQIWMNCGDGTYQEASENLQIASTKWNVSCAAADYDLDGLTDLYILTYADWKPDSTRQCMNDRGLRDICGPTLFEGEADLLFHNLGHTFEDTHAQAGLVPANRGLGIVSTDLDGNGHPDFAVVNDVQENQLYLNDNGQSFAEEALVWGMAYSATGEREGSMGVDVADYNRDGLPDLWYTNYAQQDNNLLRRTSGTGFVPAADIVGLAGVSRPWVGFGTGFADLNGDGWSDLVVINGHVAYERRDSPYFQPPQLFQNRNGERFVDVSEQGGTYFAGTRSGRGSAFADLDNDGSSDLIVSHQNDPVAVLRNTHSASDWTMINLVGTTADRMAVGATVTLLESEQICRQWRMSGGSYLSQSDRRLLFKSDSDSGVNVEVTWPGGQQEVFSGLQTQTVNTLIQGRGQHVTP
jgi:hypothetical protein